MDAECARADLEALRQDVWSSVDAKVNRVNKFNFKTESGILNYLNGKEINLKN